MPCPHQYSQKNFSRVDHRMASRIGRANVHHISFHLQIWALRRLVVGHLKKGSLIQTCKEIAAHHVANKCHQLKKLVASIATILNNMCTWSWQLRRQQFKCASLIQQTPTRKEGICQGQVQSWATTMPIQLVVGHAALTATAPVVVHLSIAAFTEARHQASLSESWELHMTTPWAA